MVLSFSPSPRITAAARTRDLIGPTIAALLVTRLAIRPAMIVAPISAIFSLRITENRATILLAAVGRNRAPRGASP
jgi:hypothetical protein